MSWLSRDILILIAFSLSSSGQTPSDLTITPFPSPPINQSLYPGNDINGLQIGRANNGNYILITESQQELIPRQYGYISMDWDRIIDNNLPASWKDNPANTPDNERHTGNYLVASNNILGQEVMGVIDKSGNVIIPLVHSNLTNPAEETTGYRIATVRAKDAEGQDVERQGVIAPNGKWVIQPICDSLGPPNADGTRRTWAVQPWPTNNVEILDVSIGPNYTNTFETVTKTNQTSTSLYPGYDINGLSIATHNGFQKTVLRNSSGAIIPPQYGFNSMTQTLITDSNLPVRTPMFSPAIMIGQGIGAQPIKCTLANIWSPPPRCLAET